MPTKPNRAGNQQNYVPAGNGDASGEYGDNESGSNVHFTNFKKPDEKTIENQIENGNGESIESVEEIAEQPIEESNKIEKPNFFDELKQKQKEEIVNEIVRRKNHSVDGINYENTIKVLRYYTGNFGDLSRFTDEELKQLIDFVYNQDLEVSDIPYYVKKGKKWFITKQKGKEELIGNKLYTKEERDSIIAKENQKLVENSQTKQDKEIQKIFGGDTVVCFGKGYKQEDLNTIKEMANVIVGDFDILKGYVKMVGDKGNLEKYQNALNSQKEFTEEEIQYQMEREKEKYWYGVPSDEKLREDALKTLRGEIKLPNAKNAYAYWTESLNAVVYMGKMKSHTQEQDDYEFNINYKSSNKPHHSFYHEFGHAIQSAVDNIFNKKIKESGQDYQKRTKIQLAHQDFYSKLEEYRKQNFANIDYNKYFKEKFGRDYTINDRDDRFKMEMLKSELNAKGIKEFRISRYGNSNQHEFVAECFSAHYTDMNNELATQVVELFKNYQKQLKGL